MMDDNEDDGEDIVVPPPPPPPPPKRDKPKAKAASAPRVPAAIADGEDEAPPTVPTVARVSPVPGLTMREVRTRAVMRGFMCYLKRPGASVKAIWESERLEEDADAPHLQDCISWDQFAEWAQRQSWRVRRNEHWDDVRKRVEKHVKSEHVQRELDEITVLERAKEEVLSHVFGTGGMAKVKPKTLEGAIDALVKLDKRTSDKRVRVTEETAAASEGSDGTGDNRRVDGSPITTSAMLDNDGFSDADVEAMADAWARSRSIETAAAVERERDKATVDLPKVIGEKPSPDGMDEAGGDRHDDSDDEEGGEDSD